MTRLPNSPSATPSGNLTGLSDLPDGVIIGAAFVLGAVVGGALTLLARQPEEEGVRHLVRRTGEDGSRKRQEVAATSLTSLKGILLEEAGHVAQAVGSQLSQTLADQARDYVAGVLTTRTQKSSENAEEEPEETEPPKRSQDYWR